MDVKWTIRDMDTADRDAALAAARRADMRVPDWLGMAIRAYVAAERGPEAGEIMPPGALPGDAPSPPPVSLDDLRASLEIARMIAEIGARPVSQALLRRVSGILTRRLRAMDQPVHRPPPVTLPALAAPLDGQVGSTYQAPLP